MNDTKGLYGKYHITKADTGEPIEGFAFVLKPESDWRAALALRFYAALNRDTDPLLADDLDKQIGQEFVEPLAALEKLAAHCEEQDERWRKHYEENGKDEYWRGTANAERDVAEQLRGLLYEISNPAPSGHWDSYEHMQDEIAAWMEDHPLTHRDEEGNSMTDGAFYR